MYRRALRWLRNVGSRNPAQAPRVARMAQRVAQAGAPPPGESRPVVAEPTAMTMALAVLGPAAMSIVDVGARWGASQAWFRLKPLAKLYGFEPDPVECARLNQRAEPGQEEFVPLALGRENGTGTLHVTREPACSSLYPPSPAMLARFPSLRAVMTQVESLEVPLSTLETWARRACVERVDFIKLDTQGADLDILRGAGSLLDDCLGVEAEVMFDQLYVGQPLFADVDAYLRSKGFTLWRLDSLAHYTDNPSDRLMHQAAVHYEHRTVHHQAGDGRLVWGNAIYFRDRETVAHSSRDLLVLGALLAAAGDDDGSQACCQRAACLPELAQGSGPQAARDRGRFAVQAGTGAEMTPLPDDPRAYLASLPLDEADRRRILMTIGCHDSRTIPKVNGAGRVFDDPRGRYQLMHNGVRVVEHGYCGPWMTELIKLLRGHHEPQEELVFSELVRHLGPGATMVELGSYWAYYSLWFARTIPQARTVMIEPDPNFMQVGQRNFELNGLQGEFHAAAVGARSAASGPFFCESDRMDRALPLVCVDDLPRRMKVPRIDLLLADIQGAELSMLQGARQAIQRGAIRFLLLSTHHQRISGDPLTHQKCVQFVREQGGHLLAEHSVVESYSGDGLIVASFAPSDRDLPAIPISRNHPSNSLFRELEYDLDEAWRALAEMTERLQAAASRDETLAAPLAEVRARAYAWGLRLPTHERKAA